MKFILLEKKLKKVTLFSFRIFDVQQQESHLFWVHTRYTILIYVKNFTQCYRMDVLIKTGHYIDRARYMSTLWPACFRHLWAKNERIIKFRYLLDLLFTRHMICVVCVCACVCVRVCERERERESDCLLMLSTGMNEGGDGFINVGTVYECVHVYVKQQTNLQFIIWQKSSLWLNILSSLVLYTNNINNILLCKLV